MSELIKQCVAAVGMMLEAETISLDLAEDFSHLTPPHIQVSVEYTRRKGADYIEELLDLLEQSTRKKEGASDIRKCRARCTFKGAKAVKIQADEDCPF